MEAIADLLGVRTALIISLVSLAAIALIYYQRTLSWTEYRTLHRLKRRLLPPLNLFWPHAVHDKGRVEDDEFIESWPVALRSAFTTLRDLGLEPNLASSLKRRPIAPDSSETELSDLSMVLYHDDGTQTEVYVFANGDGSVDVYSHHETATTDPEGHLNDEQQDADPRGVLEGAGDHIENA